MEPRSSCFVDYQTASYLHSTKAEEGLVGFSARLLSQRPVSWRALLPITDTIKLVKQKTILHSLDPKQTYSY